MKTVKSFNLKKTLFSQFLFISLFIIFVTGCKRDCDLLNIGDNYADSIIFYKDATGEHDRVYTESGLDSLSKSNGPMSSCLIYDMSGFLDW